MGIEELLDDLIDEVFAAQEIVAGAGMHFDHAVEQFQHGHVEGAAAQVEDQELGFILALVQAVGQGRGGGLADQALHLQAGQLAGVPAWPCAAYRKSRPAR